MSRGREAAKNWGLLGLCSHHHCPLLGRVCSEEPLVSGSAEMSPALWIKKLFTLRLVKCEEYVRGAAGVIVVTYGILVPQGNETGKT